MADSGTDRDGVNHEPTPSASAGNIRVVEIVSDDECENTSPGSLTATATPMTRTRARKRKATAETAASHNTAAGRQASLQTVYDAQLKWFSKVPTNIPFGVLDNPLLTDWAEALVKFGRSGGDPTDLTHGKPLVLKCAPMKAHIEAELALFYRLLRLHLRDIHSFCHGHTFARCMHDKVTLNKNQTFAAVGLQFCDPELVHNWVACLDVVPCSDTETDDTRTRLQETTFERVTSLPFHDITISNGPVDRPATLLRNFEQICGMRCSGTAPPIPAATVVVQAAQALAKFCVPPQRRALLKGLEVPGGVPDIVPQMDSCPTGIDAQRNVLRSLLRLHKALRRFCKAMPEAPQLDNRQWLILRDIEAIMGMLVVYTTTAQSELPLMRALGVVAQTELMNQLRSRKVRAIVMDSVSETDTEPRDTLSVEGMTPVGKTIWGHLVRAVEKQWASTTVLTIQPQDASALLLDPRTLLWAFRHLGESEFIAARLRIKTAHVALAKKIELAKRATPACVDEQHRNAVLNTMDPTVAALIRFVDPDFQTVAKSVEKRRRLEARGSGSGSSDADAALDEKLAREFDEAWGAWNCLVAVETDWRELHQGVTVQHPPAIDLRAADVAPILEAAREDPAYGLLPLLATHSEFGICTHAPAHYAELVQSIQGEVAQNDAECSGGDGGNGCGGGEVAEAEASRAKLLLRMNWDLLTYLKRKYGDGGGNGGDGDDGDDNGDRSAAAAAAAV